MMPRSLTAPQIRFMLGAICGYGEKRLAKSGVNEPNNLCYYAGEWDVIADIFVYSRFCG
jgi:hypothetical protein